MFVLLVIHLFEVEIWIMDSMVAAVTIHKPKLTFTELSLLVVYHWYAISFTFGLSKFWGKKENCIWWQLLALVVGQNFSMVDAFCLSGLKKSTKFPKLIAFVPFLNA